jgi:RNA polymerase sigma-70 factor (ECF subfamily)
MNPPASDEDRWFVEQILPHEPALRAWLATRYSDTLDIDDFVQDTFFRVLKARKTIGINSSKAFLFTTARNLVLDHLRHSNVLNFEPLTEIEEWRVLEDMPGIRESVGRKQELEILTQAIQVLPERCRQVLTLRKIYGLSQKQIAAELGIAEHTVEVQVRLGVRRCAAYLAMYGLP